MQLQAEGIYSGLSYRHFYFINVICCGLLRAGFVKNVHFVFFLLRISVLVLLYTYHPMNKTVRFSPCNPIRFVKDGLPLSDSFGYAAYGQAGYMQSLQQWQQKTTFMQKVQYDDLVTIQVHVQRGCTNAEIQLFDHNDRYLVSIPAISQVEVPGNLTPDGSQFVTLQYPFTPGSVSQLDGKEFIYLRLLTSWGTDIPNDYYVSEPIWLRQKHPNTVQVMYSNNINDYDTIFEQIKPVFRLRIPSMGLSLRMGGEYTVFENQAKELSKLSAKSYRNFSWEIGGTTGVPDYIADSISHVLNCDYVSIDGRSYKKEDGAELEVVGDENASLQFYKLLLREANHQSSYTYGQRDVLLWQRPATGFPYAMFEVHMTNGQQHMYSGVRLHDDEAGELELIDNWQARRAEWGLRGEFVQGAGGSYYYRQAEGENFWSIPPTIYAKVLTFTVYINPTGPTGGLGFKYTFKGGSHVFAPAAAGVAAAQYNTDFGNAGQERSCRYTMPSGGYQAPRIFHNDAMLNFSYRGATFAHEVINISGVAPAGLQSFEIYKGNFFGTSSLDIEFLRPCSYSLRELLIRHSYLKAIKSGWGNPGLPLFARPFPHLNNISLEGNIMNSAAVNSFINDVANGIYLRTGGSLNVKTTAGSSPPTPLSLASRNLLASKGWSVQHD